MDDAIGVSAKGLPHHCEGMVKAEENVLVLYGKGRWFIMDDETGESVDLAYCPFCGEQL